MPRMRALTMSGMFFPYNPRSAKAKTGSVTPATGTPSKLLYISLIEVFENKTKYAYKCLPRPLECKQHLVFVLDELVVIIWLAISPTKIRDKKHYKNKSPI